MPVQCLTKDAAMVEEPRPATRLLGGTSSLMSDFFPSVMRLNKDGGDVVITWVRRRVGTGRSCWSVEKHKCCKPNALPAAAAADDGRCSGTPVPIAGRRDSSGGCSRTLSTTPGLRFTHRRSLPDLVQPPHSLYSHIHTPSVAGRRAQSNTLFSL
jgi:hypothetical protein